MVADGDSGDSLPAALATAGAAPLVGRGGELARVGSLLADVSRASKTLFIVGEPGVGKTRLAAAVAADAVGRGFTVLHGRCEEGLAAPYQPVIEAFGPWLAACPDVALGRMVGDGGADLVHLWPELAVRLDVSGNRPGQDPEAQRWRVFQAVAALVGSLAEERPLLMVVDDLQWAEPSTLLLLAHLVRRAVPRRRCWRRCAAPKAPRSRASCSATSARPAASTWSTWTDSMMARWLSSSVCASANAHPMTSPDSCVGIPAATRSSSLPCSPTSTRRRRCVHPTEGG